MSTLLFASPVLTLATLSGLSLAALPAQAQTTLPFSGNFTGGQVNSIPLTSTTEEDFGAFSSSNASYSLDKITTHYFVTFASTATSYSYSLTPNTVSTFTAAAPDGSSVFGILTSLVGSFVSPQEQDYQGSFQITGGTGKFQSAKGTFADQGVANVDDSVDNASVIGTIIVPAAVPEFSTTVSFGLLLVLGGVVASLRRKKASV